MALVLLGAAPAALVAVTLCVLAAVDGGFGPSSLYPGGLLIVGATAVVLLTISASTRLSAGAIACALLLLALAIWQLASAGWSANPGVAWEEADRTLILAAVFAVFLFSGLGERSAIAIFTAWIAAIAAIAMVEVLRTAAASDPGSFLMELRFAAPVGYHNAAAALFGAAAVAGLGLSANATRMAGRFGWLLGAIQLGLAGLLAEVALLSQSRGALAAVVVAIFVMVVVGPVRVGLLARVALVAVAVGLASSQLLDPYAVASDGGDIGAAYGTAAIAIGTSTVALAIAGALFGLIERRVGTPGLVSRNHGSVAVGVVVLVLVTLAAGATLTNPVGWAQDRWDQFKQDGQPSAEAGIRIGTAGNGRYDYWRVALGELDAAPVAGAGSGSFSSDYLVERRTDTEPRYTHSLPLQVLGENGLIGIGLFVGFAGLSIVLAIRSRLSGSWRAGFVAPALGALAFVLSQASVDWTWEFVAVSGFALAMGGVAIGGRAADGPASGVGGRRRLRILAAAASGVVCLAAIALLLFPWGAAEETDRALAGWGTDRRLAYQQVDRASGLDPLSADPAVAGGTIASLSGDLTRASGYFEDALERVPDAWFPRLQLGVIYAQMGRRGAALNELRAAHALSPRDYLISQYLARVEASQRVTVSTLNADLKRKLCERIGYEAEYCDRQRDQ